MNIDEASMFLLQDNISGYTVKTKIYIIPASWVTNWIKKKYGINTMKLLKDYMVRNGQEYKAAHYEKNTKKCFCKTIKI